MDFLNDVTTETNAEEISLLAAASDALFFCGRGTKDNATLPAFCGLSSRQPWTTTKSCCATADDNSSSSSNSRRLFKGHEDNNEFTKQHRPLFANNKTCCLTTTTTTTTAAGSKKKKTTTTTASRRKPKRPLSAYNYFFAWERQQLLKELPVRPQGKPRRSHGKINFAQLTKVVSEKWNMLSAVEKAPFETMAKNDKARYLLEKQVWNNMSLTRNFFQDKEDEEEESTSVGSKEKTLLRVTSTDEDAASGRNSTSPENKSFESCSTETEDLLWMDTISTMDCDDGLAHECSSLMTMAPDQMQNEEGENVQLQQERKRLSTDNLCKLSQPPTVPKRTRCGTSNFLLFRRQPMAVKTVDNFTHLCTNLEHLVGQMGQDCCTEFVALFCRKQQEQA